LNADERHAAAFAFEQGDRLLGAGHPEQALPFLRSACNIDPANLLYRRARRLAQRDRCRPLSHGLWTSVKLAAARLRLARALRVKHAQTIMQLAEAVLDLDVRVAPAHDALACAFERAGMRDQAIWALEQGMLVSSETQSLREKLYRFYVARGSFTQAAELKADPPPTVDECTGDLLRQIECHSAEPAPYLAIAECYAKAGLMLKARRYLQEGLLATRNDFEIAMALTDIDLDVFRRDHEIVQQMLEADPASADLNSLQDRLLREILARETDQFRQRAQRFPAEPAHRVQLGIRLLKAGQFDEALETFLALRSDAQWSGRALLYAAYCHFNRGKLEKAAPLLHEALVALGPDAGATKKEVLYLLAEHYSSCGQWKEALAHAEELLRLDPRYREIEARTAVAREMLRQTS
jgi:tetratricopeptide (TPR) repeat protein